MRITVDLSDACYAAVHDLAALERRRPADQAAVLLDVALGLRPHASANGQDPCPLCGHARRPAAAGSPQDEGDDDA